MTDETVVATSTKPEPKTDRKAVASTTWLNAKGEAEHPMDDVTSVEFTLDSLQGRKWALNLADARAAMESAGLEANEVNAVLAFAGFGFKTKATNEASGVRNNPKLDEADKGPEAQGSALDEWMSEWQAGNWRAGRGEGESLPGAGDLAQAIFNFQTRGGKATSLDAVKASVAKADKDLRKKWRANPDIKAELLRIQSERAEAKRGTKVEGAAGNDDLMAV